MRAYARPLPRNRIQSRNLTGNFSKTTRCQTLRPNKYRAFGRRAVNAFSTVPATSSTGIPSKLAFRAKFDPTSIKPLYNATRSGSAPSVFPVVKVADLSQIGVRVAPGSTKITSIPHPYSSTRKVSAIASKEPRKNYFTLDGAMV